VRNGAHPPCLSPALVHFREFYSCECHNHEVNMISVSCFALGKRCDGCIRSVPWNSHRDTLARKKQRISAIKEDLMADMGFAVSLAGREVPTNQRRVCFFVKTYRLTLKSSWNIRQQYLIFGTKNSRNTPHPPLGNRCIARNRLPSLRSYLHADSHRDWCARH